MKLFHPVTNQDREAFVSSNMNRATANMDRSKLTIADVNAMREAFGTQFDTAVSASLQARLTASF
jgi:hypothetical protein